MCKFYNFQFEKLAKLHKFENSARLSRRREGEMVRQKGLEPPPRKGLDPKSSASTNFATLASLSGGPRRTRTYDRPVMSRML